MSTAVEICQKFFPEVTSVTDSTKPATIEVTKQDAASKAVKVHNACAMAVACKRKFHLDGVIISRVTAYLIKGKHARRFQLPPSVSREVTSFDRGGGFAVGTYQLSAINKSKRLGSQKGSPKHSKEGNGHPKTFRHMTSGIRSVLGGQEPE
jgi:hypothetical protein